MPDKGETMKIKFEGAFEKHFGGEADVWVTYAPKFLGNRESETPATMEIRPLSAEDTGRYQVTQREKFGFRGETVDDAPQVTRKMFVKNVRNIKNLSMEDSTGKEQAITSGEELWGMPALLPLVQEIQAAITDFSVLDEGMVKNSVLQSDGNLNKAKNGTA